MKYKFNSIGDFMQSAFDELKKAGNTTDGITGIPSGFVGLDKITHGWQNGDLVAIGSRPGMGKTSFMLSMIKNVAIDRKIPTLLFSPCMRPENVANAVLANMCSAPIDGLRSGNLRPYEWGIVIGGVKTLLESDLLFIDSNPILKIDDLCEKAKEAVAKHDIKIVFIDYLQMLYQDVKYSDNRYLELNYFTRRLKGLARELDIPIIITSQLNRDVERRESYGYYNCLPRLTDFRDSGTICDDCDIAIFIHRPEYYHVYIDDMGNDLHNVAEIILAKHRNGPLTECRLNFISEYGRFEDVPEK